MAFRRRTDPPSLPKGEALTAALVGLGMAFAAEPAREPNIENTLLAASIEGMEQEDLRVLAMLLTWLEIHSAWVNVDRLTFLVDQQGAERVRAFWSAVGH